MKSILNDNFNIIVDEKAYVWMSENWGITNLEILRAKMRGSFLLIIGTNQASPAATLSIFVNFFRFIIFEAD